MTNPPPGPWGRPPQVPPTERIPSQVPPPEATQRISRQAPPEPPTQQFQTANASPPIAPEEPGPPTQNPLRRLVSDPLSIVLVLVTVVALGLAAIVGGDDREIVVPRRDGSITMTGEAYLKHWALPNMFFHVTTAYDILRHHGVLLGKPDYMSHISHAIRKSE